MTTYGAWYRAANGSPRSSAVSSSAVTALRSSSRPRPYAGVQHPVQDAQPVQDPGGVGRELQAGPELGELRGLLKHPDLVPVAGQGQGGGQPADAAADDQDVHLIASHDPRVSPCGRRGIREP